jgi:hypothetical protein
MSYVDMAQSTTVQSPAVVQSGATASVHDPVSVASLFPTKKEGSKCPYNGWCSDAFEAIMDELEEGEKWKMFSSYNDDGTLSLYTNIVSTMEGVRAPYNTPVPVATLHPTKNETTIYAGELDPVIAEAMMVEGVVLATWRTSKANNRYLSVFVAPAGDAPTNRGVKKTPF